MLLVAEALESRIWSRNLKSCEAGPSDVKAKTSHFNSRDNCQHTRPRKSRTTTAILGSMPRAGVAPPGKHTVQPEQAAGVANAGKTVEGRCPARPSDALSTLERSTEHGAAKRRAHTVPRQRSWNLAAEGDSTLPRQVRARCGSEEHPAASGQSTPSASVKSTLRRQVRARCGVRSKALYSVSSERAKREAPCRDSDSSYRTRMVVSFLSAPGETVTYRSALRTI